MDWRFRETKTKVVKLTDRLVPRRAESNYRKVGLIKSFNLFLTNCGIVNDFPEWQRRACTMNEWIINTSASRIYTYKHTLIFNVCTDSQNFNYILNLCFANWESIILRLPHWSTYVNERLANWKLIFKVHFTSSPLCVCVCARACVLIRIYIFTCFLFSIYTHKQTADRINTNKRERLPLKILWTSYWLLIGILV